MFILDLLVHIYVDSLFNIHFLYGKSDFNLVDKADTSQQSIAFSNIQVFRYFKYYNVLST